ncbi:MAG TPA: two-component regulator propeller domain-containing protein, partial [Ardenticatenaceae bacterium]|nr:two-component regulator propeller domain-containing protein [Ardenticatenaceae bacterium]
MKWYRLPLFFLIIFAALTPPASSAQGSFWATFRTDNSGLAFNEFVAIAEDPSGRAWFGGTGVSMVGPRDDQWAWYTAGNSPLASDRVYDLAVAPDGRVWIATEAGAASLRPDGTDWQLLTRSQGLPSDVIRVVEVAGNGDVWFGTDGGAAVRSGQDGSITTYSEGNSELPSNSIRDIMVAVNGDVWIATHRGIAVLRAGGSWLILNQQSAGLRTDDIRGLAQDSRQDVWVATWDGAARIAPGGGGLVSFGRDNSGLPDNNLTRVAIGPDDTPWLGSANSGVVNSDPFRGFWQVYDARTLGVTSNTVMDLERGLGRALWMGTPGGAAVFNPDGPRRPAFAAATATLVPAPTRTPIPLGTRQPTATRPTRTPPPTRTPRPTRTPEPTRTAVPTRTPEPTRTPRPPTRTPAATRTRPRTATPAGQGGAGVQPTPIRDSYEPNDRPERAYGPLTPGVAYPSYLSSASDRDYFWFELAVPGQLQLRLSQIPAGMQYGLYLFGPDQRVLSNATGSASEQVVRHSTDRAGRYSVLIWSPVGDYDP